MKKWMFVCALVTLGGFMVEPAAAQQAVPPSSPTPVVTSGAPVTMAPARRVGLLGRIRDRRNGQMMTPVSQPVLQPTITTPSTIPTTPSTQSSNTTTPQTIQQASYTEPVVGDNTTPVTQTRTGLLSRMRARRGR